MPTRLRAIPPTALCSAIGRSRRPMWSSSSTRSSELSRITAPAASAVTSLFWPKAMPTVAAVRAGASLMPSPRKTVLARGGLGADDLQLLLGGLAGVHLVDADLARPGSAPPTRGRRRPAARGRSGAGAQVADERAALGARLVAEAERRGVAAVDQRRRTPGRRRPRAAPPAASADAGAQVRAAGDLRSAARRRCRAAPRPGRSLTSLASSGSASLAPRRLEDRRRPAGASSTAPGWRPAPGPRRSCEPRPGSTSVSRGWP